LSAASHLPRATVELGHHIRAHASEVRVLGARNTVSNSKRVDADDAVARH
jgi:hypothetical protein